MTCVFMDRLGRSFSLESHKAGLACAAMREEILLRVAGAHISRLSNPEIPEDELEESQKTAQGDFQRAIAC